jgi:uncharacterized protein YraI
MMRIVLAMIVTVGWLFGVTPQNALFGTVTGVADNDTLNVRSHPDYHAAKVGALPPGALVGVDRCKRLKQSTWCRIHHIAQHDYPQYSYGAADGWVNTRFLRLSDRGYVLTYGKGKCAYALSCRAGACDVVTGIEEDAQGRIAALQHVSIERHHLRAESHFGAAAENGEGYCTNGKVIEDFLKKQPRPLTTKKAPKSLTINILHWLRSGNIEEIARHIHPTHGITLTEMVSFDADAKHHFDPKILLSIYQSGKILHWGEDYAKGNPIRMSLRTYLSRLTRDPRKLTRIDNPCDQKIGVFAIKKHGRLACHEARWVNRHSKTRDYDWLGLVVVMEQYHGTWYIVGLMHDRWTI